MTEFTKERLDQIARLSRGKGAPSKLAKSLAAFALAMLDQNEALRRDKFQLGEERAAEWKRAETAEEARDYHRDQSDKMMNYAGDKVAELEEMRAERDRLRAQLDSILANSDSLESGKLADAHAEIKRLREELAEAEEAIRRFCMVIPADVHPAVRRARERAK